MTSYYYLFVDLACLFFPLIASFYPKFPFYKSWQYFIPANFIVAAFFILWDMLFTKLGVWGFNPQYLLGINLNNLPFEEVLFFFCIPYACVFTYFSLDYFNFKNPLLKFERQLTIVYLLVALAFVIFYYNRLYPFVTGIFLSILLFYILIKKINMAKVHLSYLLIYPFFLLSNGFLTGTGLSQPIVWYNSQQIIGFRIGTIPFEDTFYGMLLIYSTILIFDFYRNNKNAR